MNETLWFIYSEICEFVLASLRFWIPYKDFRYYHAYLRRVERAQEQTGPGLWHPTSPMHLLACLALGFSFNFVVQALWLYGAQASPYRRFIHADPFYFVLRHQSLHLLVPGLSFMTYLIVYCAYLSVTPIQQALFCRLLNYPSRYRNHNPQNQHEAAFVEAHHKIAIRIQALEMALFDSNIINRFPLRLMNQWLQPSRLLMDIIRQWSIVILNVLQIFTLASGIALSSVMGAFLIHAIDEFREELFHSGISGLLDYATHWVNMYSIIFCIGFYAHMNILVGSLGITIIPYFMLSIQQNYRYLQRSNKKRIDWAKLDRFLWANIHHFELLFIGDDYFRSMIFGFMMVHGPLSAYLIISVLFDNTISLPAGFVIVFFFAHESLGIFGIHFYLGKLCKTVHAPGRLLLHLAVGNAPKVANFRARLRLSHAIARLHVCKMYGVHYGSFGLITMSSFAKCLLIYGEFLMYAYTFVREKYSNEQRNRQ